MRFYRFLLKVLKLFMATDVKEKRERKKKEKVNDGVVKE
jgi:hypothetical protein